MSGERKRRSLAVGALAAAALGPLALAGVASAAATPATLAVDHACYVVTHSRPPVTITGSGYTPGDPVSVTDTLDGIDAQPTANALGQISLTVKAPVPILSGPGEKLDTITAVDFPATGGEIKGTTTTQVSTIAALHGATKKRPGLRAFREKTKWAFSGYPGAHVYGHFTFGGRLVATEDFGRTKGPCGILKVHRKLLPVTPRHQSYKVQIDDHRKFSKKTEPRIDLKVALLEF
jgi:hypothetical protein